MRMFLYYGLLASLLFGAAVAGAQVLVDPTRPPDALATQGDSVEPGGPVLQSVKLSPERKLAVISGEVVLLGGRYGESRLVKLTETEAVLKKGNETTVLRMYPLISKSGDTQKPGSAGAGNRSAKRSGTTR